MKNNIGLTKRVKKDDFIDASSSLQKSSRFWENKVFMTYRNRISFKLEK